jgi:hypothetical protein
MLELRTEHLYDSRGTVKPFSEWMIVGDGGWGIRLIAPVIEGTVEGPRIKGVLREFGADWLVLRHDNVFVVDVRCVVETDDGALIHTYYDGIMEVPEETIAEMLGGNLPPFVARIHTTPRFETGHEKYKWLNKIKAVAIGECNSEKDPPEIRYSVYALR